MASQGADRRVRRTRKLLETALIELVLERGYEAVNVQDILDRADVGRSTFYAHVRDKDDLLLQSIGGLRTFLMQQRSAAAAEGQMFGFTHAMFEHAASHRDLYRVMVGKHSGTLVQREIARILADLVRTDLARLPGMAHATPAATELRVAYVVGAFLAVLTWWLEHGQATTPDEMDRTFHQLVLPGLLPTMPTP